VANEAALTNRPLRVQTARGEPLEVMGRILIPVARITSFGKGRATVGRDGVQGWAAAFCRVAPQAVIEEAEGGEHYVAITDATQSILRRMLAAALGMTVLFILLRRLA